jgi:two-component system chemotaxis response regulator CheY
MAQRLSFLVVDDSLITIKKVTAMIETLGHRVIRTAQTGAEALAAYQSCNPDVVSMDITMPDMDGIEATKRIVNAFPKARIVMVTSHGQEQMVLSALEAGASGYVLKPIKIEKLSAMIAKVMKLKPMD